ncbi:MAG: hypothetical protein WCF77_03715 [Minisyncoccia bacterium]
MMEHLAFGDDGGFSEDKFKNTEAELAAQVEQYERQKAAEEWSTPEDVYFEFPGAFPEVAARKKAAKELGGADIEHMSPQAVALRYLNDPNNRESGVFRYLTDWRIDPERGGEGIKLSFQRPPSPDDRKEIERIFRTFGWDGEEYEVKKESARE